MKKIILPLKSLCIAIAALGLLCCHHAADAQYIINTVAGNGFTYYGGDGGQSVNAQLSLYNSERTVNGNVATDGSGNVYIADAINNVVRKVNSSGIISTIAGNATSGYSGDGAAATAARLNGPNSVAVDGSGNVYIGDAGNNVIRRINTSGIISTVAGNRTAGYSGDGAAASAAALNYASTSRMSLPGGIGADTAGNLYIADAGNNVIRMVNTSGIISTIAGTGISGYSGDGGSATVAKLNNPNSLAIDGAGNIYIGDGRNNVIRKINTSGTISTVAGTGESGYTGDGSDATAAHLTFYVSGYSSSYGGSVAVDNSGNLFIADVGNNVIRKVNTSGIISSVGGNGTSGFTGDGGAATSGEFNIPGGIAVDGSGNVFVADRGNNRIRKISASGNLSTFAGGPGVGQATSMAISAAGTVMDGNGNLYISDLNGNVLRKIDPSGYMTIFAGNGVAGYSGDGGQATSAMLNGPEGIAVDASGNIYVADNYNGLIRKINTSGIISTVAGHYGASSLGDGGLATDASLEQPFGVAFDPSGNMFIADHDHLRIRKVDAVTGYISTYAGTGDNTYTYDGDAATSAGMACTNVATDLSGNVYVSDYLYGAVRKINTSGIVTTVAGGGAGAFTDDAVTATSVGLNYPYGIATDAAGNLYIADVANHRIRKVSTSGIMTTLAGAGTNGDGGPAFAARLGNLYALSVDSYGSVYITDNNNRVRMLSIPPAPITGTFTVCPGSTTALGDTSSGGIWSSSNPTVVTVGSTGTATGNVGGTATISYTTGRGSATAIITVNVANAGTITGASSVTTGSSITLTDAVSGGTWSPSNANATVSGGVVNGVSIGSVIISYTVTGCGTASATKTITITPASLPAITGNMAICVSAGTALSNTVTGGAWTTSDPTVATVGSASGYVTGTGGGTAVITYSATGIFTTAVVTVSPGPGPITGTLNICNGAASALAATTPTSGGGVAQHHSFSRDSGDIWNHNRCQYRYDYDFLYCIRLCGNSCSYGEPGAADHHRRFFCMLKRRYNIA